MKYTYYRRLLQKGWKADCCKKGGNKNQFNQIDILHLFQIVRKPNISKRAKKEMK